MNSFERQITNSGTKRAVIEVDLFKKGSIDNLIAQLEAYKASIPDMLETAINRLLEAGYKVATDTLRNSGSGDSERNDEFHFDVSKDGRTVYGTLYINPITMTTASGKEFTPYLAWEFGAGIYYNNGNAHPKAAELGMGVGTYPGQTHAINPGHWLYRDKSGNLHQSVGTEATMPLHKASLEMIEKAEQIIKGAFW